MIAQKIKQVNDKNNKVHLTSKNQNSINSYWHQKLLTYLNYSYSVTSNPQTRGRTKGRQGSYIYRTLSLGSRRNSLNFEGCGTVNWGLLLDKTTETLLNGVFMKTHTDHSNYETQKCGKFCRAIG